MNAAQVYMHASGNWDMMLGRVLSVPGRIEEDPERSGAMIGEVSGLVALFAPWFTKMFNQAVPLDTLFLPNWNSKLDAIVESTLTQDIRSIVMVPSWAVVLFRKLIDRFNQRYDRRVSTVREIWPNLTVFFSGGVALSSYRSLLEKQIGEPSIDFVESYGASEGFIAFQDRLGATDMLVHPSNGVFMEFIRADVDSEEPYRYTIHEVERDVRYELLVTTCSGLWSYRVGDVVQFTSTDPHRILVSGRTTEMLDIYGEAVFGDEARAAIEEACRKTDASFQDYHVAPIPISQDRMPGHQWLVEFEVPPVDLPGFAAEIDKYLQRVNRHYVIRREAEAFTAPEVYAVPPGTFYEWLLRNRKMVSAQSKIPRMSVDRRIADEVVSISENKT
jgi:hypothetical protein